MTRWSDLVGCLFDTVLSFVHQQQNFRPQQQSCLGLVECPSFVMFRPMFLVYGWMKLVDATIDGGILTSAQTKLHPSVLQGMSFRSNQ